MTNSQTRLKYPLSRRKIYKKTIGNSIVWFLITIVPLSSSTELIEGVNREIQTNLSITTSTETYLISAAVFLALVFLSYLYQVWYFNTYYYELTANEVVIKKNPVTPKEISIPYERLQDVYVDQDIIDRIFGLYDVHISSATSSSNYLAHIDGLEKAAADGLREELLNTIKKRLQKTINNKE